MILSSFLQILKNVNFFTEKLRAFKNITYMVNGVVLWFLFRFSSLAFSPRHRLSLKLGVAS